MNLLRRDKASPVVPPRPSSEELNNPITHSLSVNEMGSKSQENNNDDKSGELPKTKRTGMMGVMQKVNPFKSTSQASTASRAPGSDAIEGKAPDATQNPGMLKGVIQKVNPFKSTTQVKNEDPPTDTVDHQATDRFSEGKQNPGVFKGMMQKVNPFKSAPQTQETQSLHSDRSSSADSLAENNNSTEKQNPGMFKGMMQKVNPFKSTTQTQQTQTLHSDSSSSTDSLAEFKNPTENQTVWYTDNDASGDVKSPQVEEKKKMFGTLRIRRILPGALFGSGAKDSNQGAAAGSSQGTESQPTAQESSVEIQPLEMASVPVPSEGNPLESEDDEDGLVNWWRTVEGWDEWNESSNFQEDEGELAVEEAADRVFMAARLFVRFFNQRGASLQQHILELLSLADAADTFHKNTLKASVGGGVASVAGSITTITGLILAPFTMGTSLIVTAVGIGVATAGGVASASANITDTVHSKTDRKKVEKIIQNYQDEMKDIKDCLDFVQTGMETLEEWQFEQYADSISKKHLNQNVKHVIKEGGRAGKALLINTESLISTVQVLSVAGGAAKAAQVMSITTGVMSGLFLALDVFFLTKDSLELRKGAKTEFAGKIREVCKDLQNGLLELNHIKAELQKTMDGIEVEVYEKGEEEDEEGGVDEEDEEEQKEGETEEDDVLKSDPKKLAELEE